MVRMKPQNLVTGLPVRTWRRRHESARHCTIPVGVVVERRKAESPWVDRWRADRALPGTPDSRRGRSS